MEDEPAPTAFVTARPILNHRFDRSVMRRATVNSVAPKAHKAFGPRVRNAHSQQTGRS
jgi:hypothetical protein